MDSMMTTSMETMEGEGDKKHYTTQMAVRSLSDQATFEQQCKRSEEVNESLWEKHSRKSKQSLQKP